MNILFLYNVNSAFVGTTRSHITAFKGYSIHKVVELDFHVFRKTDVDLSMFDCIVIHHSIPVGYGNTLSDQTIERLKGFQGLKALFIQDEMRWVESTCDKIEKIGISLVFTVVNPEVVRDIYRGTWFDRVRFEHVLTGYVPEELLDVDVPAYEDRQIDVSYRARKLPAWCGSFGQEKSIIADRFLADAAGWSLNCDISCKESARIYGDDWVRFVADSRATLGAESGASFIDYSGQIAPAVDDYERRHPEASFEEVRDKFLEGRDGRTVIHVISPRCFEAAALRTLMVMYEGAYSGILEAGRHYVPLARDHSNMAEVVAILRDPEKAKTIIEAAYREIACSGKWSYKTLIEQFDQAVGEEWKRLGIPPSPVSSLNKIDACSAKWDRMLRWNKIKYGTALYLGNMYRKLESIEHSTNSPRIVVVLLRALREVVEPIKKLLGRLLLG